jgi:hypothetical protein
VRPLNGIVGVFSWDHTTAVLQVHEEKLQRCPSFAPEVVVGNKLVPSSTDQKVVDNDAEEQVGEENGENNDEKGHEEASGFDDFGSASELRVKCQKLKRKIEDFKLKT